MRTILFAFLFTSYSLAAQDSETRKLSSFTALDASEGIEVIMTRGSNPEARVEVTNVDLDDVITEVSGRTLNIELRGNNNYRNAKITVYVTFQSLEEVNANSAADVIFESVIEGAQLEIDVNSAGYVEARLEVEELEVDASSSGKVKLSGSATTQKVDVSSAASYDGADLDCDYAVVEANSAGSATVNVARELNAEANSAGKISYKGNPDKVFSDASSGGKVRKY